MLRALVIVKGDLECKQALDRIERDLDGQNTQAQQQHRQESAIAAQENVAARIRRQRWGF